MAYRFNSEDEIREAFWSEHPQFQPSDKGERQNDQPADTRMAFVDWIDQLQKSGEISEDLAQDVTL